MSVTRIATRYAKSLLDLAVEKDKLERVKADVDIFKEAVKVRDFYLLLKSPIVKADKKMVILHTLFDDKFDRITFEFLNILVRKGREAYLPEIAKEFIDQYRKVKKISVVKVTTAKPLTQQALEAIRQKLLASSATNDHVEINTEVDPDLIGGFVIEFDDKLYDASVKHKVDQLRKEFKDNLYISQILSN